MLFGVSTSSWKNINDGLNFVIQTCRWLENVMIQIPFINGRFKPEVIKKPNYYKNHFSLTEEKWALLETALDVTN